MIKDIDEQYKSIDLSDLLYKDESIKESFFCTEKKNKPWDRGSLARKILRKAKKSIDENTSISLDSKISNTDRSFGALISGYIADKYGEAGLRKPIIINLEGSAGQSFGCWNANGLVLNINGDANDYVGKGMNGGRIVVKNNHSYASSENNPSLVGNTCLYGATGGDLYEMFALIDVMKNSYHHISTVGIGAIMSAGFLIFASGSQGYRYIGKNTGIMNHQHSDSMESKMHDMRAQMKENQNCELRCLNILKEATGMSMQEVRSKFIKNPSDQYYTAKQMIDMGIADQLL